MQIVVLIAFLFLAYTGSAAVVLDESFSYPDGALTTVGAGKWETHSGTAGQVAVSSGRILLKFSDGEDVNALLAGEPYATGSSAVFYTRFTVNFSALPTSSGGYFAHFKDGGFTFRGKLFALSEGASVGRGTETR